MSCLQPAWADVDVDQPRFRSGSPDEPGYSSVFGTGGVCTVWDAGATGWDAGSTEWDCGAPVPPLYAPNPVVRPLYESVLQGGECTVWDLAATIWDGGATQWDCGGNPPSDDLEDVCPR